MKPHDKIMTSEQNSQLFSSPGTDALDLILSTESVDPANLIFDLNDLLRRDPTLSSLSSSSSAKQKDMSTDTVVQPIGEDGIIGMGGVPIPKRSSELDGFDELMPATSEFEDATIINEGLSSVLNSSAVDSSGTQAFGSSYGSGFETSPLANAPTSPSLWDKSAIKMEMESNLDASGMSSSSSSNPMFYDSNDTKPQPTLAQLNSPPLDTDFNWDTFFMNDEARNMTLTQTTIKPSNTFSHPQQQHQQRQQLQQQKEQQGTIKSEFTPDMMLSSSVPAGVFNSPLSDILPEITPSSPGKMMTISPSMVTSGHPRSASFSGQKVNISSQASLPPATTTMPPSSSPGPSHVGPERVSTLHKLLLAQNRPSPVRSPENRNMKTLVQMKSSLLSASNPLLSQQLSKSAPTQHSTYLDRLMWTRREPRPHMNSVCSVGGESSVADDVSDVLNGLSPTNLPDIASDDEEEEEEKGNMSFQDDGDSSNDDFSDEEEEEKAQPKSDSKKERHFWQYNVQAKGPKGQKIVVETKIEDPHELNEIVDPVFAGDVQLQGIKHSGKARRGDGNDLTSNPKKLALIGKELEQLSKIINDLTPVSEMPFAARCKSRKEKNKLASRACRLKKKAQHEANKLKCCGLRDEHHMLLDFINRSKDILKAKVDPKNTISQAELTSEIDRMVKKVNKSRVAGETTEYVNRQIEKYGVNS